jgi:hypothetical protein
MCFGRLLFACRQQALYVASYTEQVHACLCVCGCLQDILIQGEGGAQILVDPELAEHFEVTGAGAAQR